GEIGGNRRRPARSCGHSRGIDPVQSAQKGWDQRPVTPPPSPPPQSVLSGQNENRSWRTHDPTSDSIANSSRVGTCKPAHIALGHKRGSSIPVAGGGGGEREKNYGSQKTKQNTKQHPR